MSEYKIVNGNLDICFKDSIAILYCISMKIIPIWKQVILVSTGS